MAITINTNIASLIVQKNLQDATNGMNSAIERMTTGLKINKASDDAAGMAVATRMESKLSSAAVANSNAQIGSSMLTTAEGNLDLISEHLQRVRDLTEQAANGTYGTDAMIAIKTEVASRLDEIDRLVGNAEFNGKKLLDGTTSSINLQVGTGSTANDYITIEGIFESATSASLVGVDGAGSAAKYADDSSARGFLTEIDKAIDKVTERKTKIGAYQNRVSSAVDALEVQVENLTSSVSTIKDADIATESSNYIKNQILQQAAASLLTTANQTPSIALNLV